MWGTGKCWAALNLLSSCRKTCVVGSQLPAKFLSLGAHHGTACTLKRVPAAFYKMNFVAGFENKLEDCGLTGWGEVRTREQ